MADLEAVKARIRALLARTPARGCTEAEAVEAAAKALQLMREHALDEASVECGRMERPLGRAKRSDVDRLWPAVAAASRCELFYLQREQLSIVYVGRLPWPDVASYLHDLAAGAAARATREYCKTTEYRRRRTTKTKTQARDAFRAGFAAGLAGKIQGLADVGDPAYRADRALAAEAKAAEGPMQTMRPTKSAALQPRFAGSVGAGYAAGRRTQVGWGVGGPAATRLLERGG